MHYVCQATRNRETEGPGMDDVKDGVIEAVLPRSVGMLIPLLSLFRGSGQRPFCNISSPSKPCLTNGEKTHLFLRLYS